MSAKQGLARVVPVATALGALCVACWLASVLVGCSLEIPPTPMPTATPAPLVPATLTPGATPVPTARPYIYISPATVTVEAGEPFSVTIVISATERMRGAQAGLRFDPALLEATGCEEGALLKEWAQADEGSTVVIPPQAEINNKRGSVSLITVVIFGGQRLDDGPMGAGSFLVCHLRARPGASGQSALTLSQAMISDAKGRIVPGLVVGGGQVVVGTGQTGQTSEQGPGHDRARKLAAVLASGE